MPAVSLQHTTDRPIHNTGVGLRHSHFSEILEHRPDVPWLEVLADNHRDAGGLGPKLLEQVRDIYPITFHCVGMSLGSTSPLNWDYLRALKKQMQQYQPAWVSDHLCFTHIGSRHLHELLPLPYTEEALQHLRQRITIVQDFLGQRILIENVSSYIQYNHSTIPEWEFISQLAKMADCSLLLDVNNIFVNSINHGFSVDNYLKAIPYDRVCEIHLAGFEDRGKYLLDAHNNRVDQAVWDTFAQVMHYNADIPALIEWDNDIPAFAVLEEEARKAENYRTKAQNIQKNIGQKVQCT